MKEFEAANRAFDFACRIVNLHKYLCRQSSTTRALASQVLRSGTSIGANLAEAHVASSRRDFVNKCSIALKEARETQYWLQLLVASELVSAARITSLTKECNELVAMLVAILRTSRLTSVERSGRRQ